MFKYTMNDEDYKNYYEIKSTYDNYKKDKITDLKKLSKHKYPNGEKYVNNWKQSDITTINKIRNIKGLCINCKKFGMIFKDQNGELLAKCGNVDDCGYNFKIEIPEYMQHEEIIEIFTKDIEEIKEKIIIWKLNLLYKLDDEDVVLREFQNLKSELEYKSMLIKKFKKAQMKKNVLNIEENGENLPISRKNLLKKLEKKIIEKKEEYKNILKEYLKNDLNDNSIQDAMELHKGIMKDIEEYRKIKYELGDIEMIPILDDKGNIKVFEMYETEINYENQQHILKEQME